MSRVRRIDPLAVVALLLFVAALALTLAGVGRGETGVVATRSGSVYDTSGGGASVLRRYLSDNGVAVSTIEGTRFAVGGSDVVFVLGATDEIDATAARALRGHVERGGTLVVATDLGFSERALLAAFDVRMDGSAEPGVRTLRGAIFAAPPARQIAVERAVRVRLPAAGESLTSGPPVVASVGVGRGTLIVVGSLDPFLNASIGEADNGRFALALAGMGRSVAFDEHHHGVRGAPNAFALLVGTWSGVALIAAGACTFLYLLLSGRRLGPAIPLDARPPRSSLDYVRAFAGLVRRSARGEIVRRRLRDELRRRVATAVGVDPATPVERAAPALGADRAREALALDALLARPLRDAELLRTVGRIERLVAPE